MTSRTGEAIVIADYDRRWPLRVEEECALIACL
jgi:hypothetical protein